MNFPSGLPKSDGNFREACPHGLTGNCAVRCTCGHRCDDHKPACVASEASSSARDCPCEAFIEQGGG